MMLYIKRRSKIMGLGRSKDLDRSEQKNHGLSRSKDLDFNRYIKEISRKMIGLSRSKDLLMDLLMFVQKIAEKSWVEPK